MCHRFCDCRIAQQQPTIQTAGQLASTPGGHQAGVIYQLLASRKIWAYLPSQIHLKQLSIFWCFVLFFRFYFVVSLRFASIVLGPQYGFSSTPFSQLEVFGCFVFFFTIDDGCLFGFFSGWGYSDDGIADGSAGSLLHVVPLVFIHVNTHTHTQTQLLMYIFMCYMRESVCVYVCVIAVCF